MKITVQTSEGSKEYTVEELDKHAHAILHSYLGPPVDAASIAKGLANCVLSLCETLTKIEDARKAALPIKDNQHCTNEECYLQGMSHTAGYCGSPQPRRCGCAFCYPEEGE